MPALAGLRLPVPACACLVLWCRGSDGTIPYGKYGTGELGCGGLEKLTAAKPEQS